MVTSYICTICDESLLGIYSLGCKGVFCPHISAIFWAIALLLPSKYAGYPESKFILFASKYNFLTASEKMEQYTLHLAWVCFFVQSIQFCLLQIFDDFFFVFEAQFFKHPD